VQGQGPFGSEFSLDRDRQFCSRLLAGAATGHQPRNGYAPDGTLASIEASPVADDQTAPCWAEISYGPAERETALAGFLRQPGGGDTGTRWVPDLIAHDKARQRIREELLLDAGRLRGEERIAGNICVFKNNAD